MRSDTPSKAARPQGPRSPFDRRRRSAKRYAELVDTFTAELGGAEGLTAAHRVTIDQLAVLTLQGEQLRAAVVRGDHVDSAELARVSNTAARLMDRLGINTRSAA